MYITICEVDRQSKFDAWDGVLNSGALGRPEGWDREGGGRGIQDEGHMYTRAWFMSIYGESHYNTAK